MRLSPDAFNPGTRENVQKAVKRAMGPAAGLTQGPSQAA